MSTLSFDTPFEKYWRLQELCIGEITPRVLEETLGVSSEVATQRYDAMEYFDSRFQSRHPKKRPALRHFDMMLKAKVLSEPAFRALLTGTHSLADHRPGTIYTDFFDIELMRMEMINFRRPLARVHQSTIDELAVVFDALRLGNRSLGLSSARIVDLESVAGNAAREKAYPLLEVEFGKAAAENLLRGAMAEEIASPAREFLERAGLETGEAMLAIPKKPNKDAGPAGSSGPPLR